MTLSINVTSASSDALHSPMNHAITALAASVARKNMRGLIPGGPSLDITFMLPGEFDQPDFTGMRMGGYQASDDTLYFERAVPQNLLHSPKAGDFVALVIEDAIANAEDFFRQQSGQFSRAPWQQLVEQLNDPR